MPQSGVIRSCIPNGVMSTAAVSAAAAATVGGGADSGSAPHAEAEHTVDANGDEEEEVEEDTPTGREELQRMTVKMLKVLTKNLKARKRQIGDAVSGMRKSALIDAILRYQDMPDAPEELANECCRPVPMNKMNK